ncbi:MAG: hypothetical protein HY294_06475 [Candidatus Rokubacteria bacterium]|nr:hypothetical protein [Candidatus Rokubacteria bacterium]
MEEGLRRLVESFDFSLLDPGLAEDVLAALTHGLAEGAVFPVEGSPLVLFREGLAAAIRDIEGHPRGRLLQRFLTIGPYWAGGEIPADQRNSCLSDEETAAATAFVYHHMVNAFQGRLAEILALPPCFTILKDLQAQGILPSSARLYAGDAVMVSQPDRSGSVKGADHHLLIEAPDSSNTTGVSVAGVVEVKSYRCPPVQLAAQLARHVAGAGYGLHIRERAYRPESVRIGAGSARTVIRIGVVPGQWHLPRSFSIVETEHAHAVRPDPAVPATKTDDIVHVGDTEWRVRLRWSKEALAGAAYEVTFWYMAKVGEVVYGGGAPKHLARMTLGEAGRNAAKMMLYYAILRARSWHDEQRAIALYNAYGFGYALGTSFKNPRGSREMLWFEDLEEILAHGKTKHGCRLVP